MPHHADDWSYIDERVATIPAAVLESPLRASAGSTTAAAHRFQASSGTQFPGPAGSTLHPRPTTRLPSGTSETGCRRTWPRQRGRQRPTAAASCLPRSATSRTAASVTGS